MALVFILSAFGSLLAMDGEEVVGKYLDARGGKAKLEKLETIHMKGTLMMSGMNGQIEIWNKAPQMYAMHMNMQMMTIKEGCNGEDVWQVTPQGLNIFEGDEKKKRLEQVRIEPMLGFTERGGVLEYVGLEPVKGVDCHKVRVIQATGDTTMSYFNAESFLLVKTDVDTPMGKVEQHFDDYKTVSGVVMPHKLRTVTPNMRVLITMSEVEVNQPVPDSLFAKPEAAEVPTVMKPLPDSLRGTSPDKDK